MAVKLRRHREGKMTLRQVLASTVAAIAIAAMNLAVPDSAAAQQPAVEIDKADIGGVVTGPSGPEAGVWVIAETTELPTKYAKIVVTDDQGRYVADPKAPESFGPPFHASAVNKPTAPSAYWGDEKIWSQRANNHNGMFDKKGRVWFAAAVRGFDNPAFCKKGSNHPSAKAFPLEQSGRQVAMLDPKTMKYSFIDTCFGTHHPQFGYDADNTLWLSGTGVVAGWVNTKVWEETGDAAKAQGWAPFVLDTSGNGKVDEWT